MTPGALGARADRVSVELAQVLGRDDVRFSVQLTVARHARDLDRVS